MKYYTVTIQLSIEAKTETEALTKFWDSVDDSDYPITPTIVEEI